LNVIAIFQKLVCLKNVYEYIQEQQEAGATLLARQEKYPAQYMKNYFDNQVQDIIYYIRPNNNPEMQW